MVPKRKGRKCMSVRCLRFVLKRVVNCLRDISLESLREELFSREIMSGMKMQMLPYSPSLVRHLPLWKRVKQLTPMAHSLVLLINKMTVFRHILKH